MSRIKRGEERIFENKVLKNDRVIWWKWEITFWCHQMHVAQSCWCDCDINSNEWPTNWIFTKCLKANWNHFQSLLPLWINLVLFTLLKPVNASFLRTWIWFSFKFKCSNSVRCFRARVGTSDNLFLERTRCFKVFPCDDMEVGPKDFISEKEDTIWYMYFKQIELVSCVNKSNVCVRKNNRFLGPLISAAPSFCHFRFTEGKHIYFGWILKSIFLYLLQSWI